MQVKLTKKKKEIPNVTFSPQIFQEENSIEKGENNIHVVYQNVGKDNQSANSSQSKLKKMFSNRSKTIYPTKKKVLKFPNKGNSQ